MAVSGIKRVTGVNDKVYATMPMCSPMNKYRLLFGSLEVLLRFGCIHAIERTIPLPNLEGVAEQERPLKTRQ